MYDGLPRPLLFAHRGASCYAPENTLTAFDLAARLGAHVLELDVHMTRDQEVVVIHDDRVERTTDGSGAVHDHTFAELSGLDAGYHFEPHGGGHLFRGRGIGIPRLAEVLASFPRMGFNIEIKQHRPSMLRAVLETLSRSGTSDVVLAAGQDRIMRELERLEPSWPLGLSSRQVRDVLVKAHLRRSLQCYAGRALQIPLRHRRLAGGLIPVATQRLVRRAHEAGLEVHLWTINDADVAGKWLKRGVDGIMTDDPSILANLFSK